MRVGRRRTLHGSKTTRLGRVIHSRLRVAEDPAGHLSHVSADSARTVYERSNPLRGRVMRIVTTTPHLRTPALEPTRSHGMTRAPVQPSFSRVRVLLVAAAVLALLAS